MRLIVTAFWAALILMASPMVRAEPAVEGEAPAPVAEPAAAGAPSETVPGAASPPVSAAEAEEDDAPPPPIRKRVPREKEAEGTQAHNRGIKDAVIKSQYRHNGQELEVDPN